MDHLPAGWTALCMLAFVLGCRHGLDADHLATIDGLTRYNARVNPWLSRRAGAFFSLGHGIIVMLVALAVATLTPRWQTPGWLEATGAAISVVFLFGLAFLNVRAVLTTRHDHPVAAAGFRGRLLGRFLTVRRGWSVFAVGMLFALSFDTISQAALFALAAARLGGAGAALLVAALFVVGMLCVDGVNGLWINRLVRGADRRAAIASRIMAWTIAAISFALGMLTLAKVVLPAIAAWAGGREQALGLAVIAAIAAAFVFGLWRARTATNTFVV